MSTQLQNFDTNQDALTIFFDLQSEQNMIDIWMKELFEEGQSLYLNEEMDGNSLFAHLRDLIREGELLFPNSGRMLFCYYLPLENLTEEWINDFFERAESLQKAVEVNNSFDQHHMICLSRATYENISDERREELAKLIIRLAKEKPLVSHQVYLLRISGFQEYTSQEHAMVQLLHMLSRRDYHKLRQQVKAGTTIKMFDYVDYYEDRAANCVEKIKKIDEWENQAVDPKMAKTIVMIRDTNNPSIEALQNASREFRKKSRVYPVSLSDFKGNFISGYTSSVTANHPILLKRCGEYTERKRLELIEATSFDSVEKFIRKEFHFPDYEELKSSLEDGSLKKAVTEGADKGDTASEIKTLSEALYEKLAGKLVKQTTDLQSLKKEKQKEKKRYMKELQTAGQYKNLEDCFARVNEDMKPKTIHGEFLELRMTLALIGGKALDGWNTNGYEIQGVREAYRYPAIKPNEIVLINESDLLNLGDSDPDTILNNMKNAF
jgi:hypothetical protein